MPMAWSRAHDIPVKCIVSRLFSDYSDPPQKEAPKENQLKKERKFKKKCLSNGVQWIAG